MQLNVLKLDTGAKLPTYSHDGDAGMDLYALESVSFGPGERVRVKTGISMEIPSGCVGVIWDKSGLASKHGLKTLGGVIDSGYRGEIMVGMVNLSDVKFRFEAGDKVAQIIIQKYERCIITEVSVLPDTPRGSGGFGSTGK